MVNSLENIDKSKVYVGRITGLDDKIIEEIGNTLTGAVSTITTSDLTADKVLVSNSNGKVATSSVTSTELGYVSGVTSSIQTQLGNKANDSSVVHTTGDETVYGIKSFRGVPTFMPGGGLTILSNDENEYWVFRSTGSNLTGCALIKNNDPNYNAFKAENDHINIGSTNILPYSVTPSTDDNSTRIATTAFVKAQGYLTEHQSLSNYVTTNTTQTISATKTFTANQNITKAKPVLQLKDTSITRGTAPSSAVNSITIQGLDSAGKNTWGIYHTWGTDKKAQTQLICYKGTTTDNTWAGIGVGYDASGNVFTYAPTPATSDDSTKIATTAWVKDQGYLTSATDTKNTAGSTDTSSKIYLVGATSQAANPQTYSHDTVYVNTSGQLVSATPDSSTNNTVVATTAFVKSVLSSSGNGLFTISKAANGYCKFNGGLIVQWGTTTANSGEQSVTYPTAFTSTNYRVISMCLSSSTTTGSGASNSVVSKTKTGCSILVRAMPGVSIGASSSEWIAIGY